MFGPLPRCFAAQLAVLLLLALGAGCERRNTHADFMPAESGAREALEIVLGAWQDGKAPNHIDTGSPAINAYDAKWRAGQKLESYEILATEAVAGKPTWFTVKLKMKSPPSELKVRYVVIGLDPISVCREEDYNKMSGM